MAVIKLVDWFPSRLSQCPRSPGHPAFLVRFSESRRRRNSWWKCLSLSPPSATGSAGRRRTGARVTRGTVVPFEGSHRQFWAVYKYWASVKWSTSLVSCNFSSTSPSRTCSSSTEGWTFQVSAGTHSANCAEDRWCRVRCATFLVVFWALCLRNAWLDRGFMFCPSRSFY